MLKSDTFQSIPPLPFDSFTPLLGIDTPSSFSTRMAFNHWHQGDCSVTIKQRTSNVVPVLNLLVKLVDDEKPVPTVDECDDLLMQCCSILTIYIQQLYSCYISHDIHGSSYHATIHAPLSKNTLVQAISYYDTPR